MLQIIDTASPNFNQRRKALDMIIIHYTGMQTGKLALERLCDENSNVSAHYFINREGIIHRLVPEEMRAWHAGVSFWKGEKDINSRSIGIELENKGHDWGYEEFTSLQIDSLISLLIDVKKRYKIKPTQILGHSDIAPLRKKDPGEKFPWHRLVQAKLVPLIKNQKIQARGRLYPLPTYELFGEIISALSDIGYKTDKVRFFSAQNRASFEAFKRHFCPDASLEETRIILQKVRNIYGSH